MMSKLHVSIKSTLSLLIFLFVAGLLHAVPTEAENSTHLVTYRQSPDHLTLKTNEGFLRVQLMDEDGILYFSFASDSVFLAPTDAVSLQPVNTSTIIRNTAEALDVRMGNVYFKVAKNPFEIRITTGADNRDEMVISGPFKIGRAHV